MKTYLEALNELYQSLSDAAAQAYCGCNHPHCSRCEDDKLNTKALEEAKKAIEMRCQWKRGNIGLFSVTCQPEKHMADMKFKEASGYEYCPWCGLKIEVVE